MSKPMVESLLPDLCAANRARLLESQAEWLRRIAAVGADRTRARGPIDPDFSEQAVQRENDATLDALDERGRTALAAMRAALSRIESGNYGWCVACGAAIPIERLQAEPTADRCIACKR